MDLSNAWTAADCVSVMTSPGLSVRMVQIPPASSIGSRHPDLTRSGPRRQRFHPSQLQMASPMMSFLSASGIQSISSRWPDALPPGAGHLGDVRAPKQPVRTKGVVHGAVVTVQAFEGIGIVGVEGAARQFDGDIWKFGQCGQFPHLWKRRVAFGALSAPI
mgnify:CR=1 FL=1